MFLTANVSEWSAEPLLVSIHHLRPKLFGHAPSTLLTIRRRQIDHAGQRVLIVRSRSLLASLRRLLPPTLDS